MVTLQHLYLEVKDLKQKVNYLLYLNAQGVSGGAITNPITANTSIDLAGFNLDFINGNFLIGGIAPSDLSLFPTTGTGTATSAVTANIDGNILSVVSGANIFLTIDPTVDAESTTLVTINNGNANQYAVLYEAVTNASSLIGLESKLDVNNGNSTVINVGTYPTQSFFQLEASFNDGVEQLSIFGNAQAGISDIAYTATTHTFTGNVGIGVAPTLLFQVQSGSNDLLSIDPTAGSEVSQLLAYNTTGGGNVSGYIANSSNTIPSFTIFADFNGGAESASILGSSQSGSSALQYLATTHTFTGKINYPEGNADSIVGTSAAMVAGTTTVNTTAVTAASKIFLTHATPEGTLGWLSPGSIVAGTSFDINSTGATDTSTVNWWIVN